MLVIVLVTLLLFLSVTFLLFSRYLQSSLYNPVGDFEVFTNKVGRPLGKNKFRANTIHEALALGSHAISWDGEWAIPIEYSGRLEYNTKYVTFIKRSAS